MNLFKAIFSTAFILSISCGTINAQPFIDSTTISSNIGGYGQYVDFDNDGDNDIVVGNSSDAVIFENDAGDFLNHGIHINISGERKSVKINNDSYVDFFIPARQSLCVSKSSPGYKIEYYRNLFDVADLNADGLDDLIYFSGSSLSVRFNRGTYFDTKISTNIGNDFIYKPLHVNIDGQGTIKLLCIVGQSQDTLVSFDYSNGQYTNRKVLSLINVGRLTSEFIDNDNLPDVVVESPQGCYWLKGKGKAGFDSMQLVSYRTGNYQPLDNDKDGFKDFLVTPNGAPYETFLIRNNGGVFKEDSVLKIARPHDDFQHKPPRIYRFSDTSKAQLIYGIGDQFAKGSAGWFVYKDKSVYDFELEEKYNGWLHVLSEFEDYNDDGLPDLLTSHWATRTLSLNLNTGSGKFTIQKLVLDSSAVSGIEAADLDGDGGQDILTIDEDNNVLSWHKFDSYGKLYLYDTLSIPVSGIHDIEIADLDNDGDKDIVVSIGFGFNSAWGIFKNSGGGSFSSFIQMATLGDADELFCEDMNADGLLDVVIRRTTNNNALIYYKNSGNGQFSSFSTTISNFRYVQSVCFPDVDNDGFKDAVFHETSLGNQFYVARSNSGHSFTIIDTIHLNYDATGSAYLDYDGDGDKDLLLTDVSSLYFVENIGNGLFAPPTFLRQVRTLSSVNKYENRIKLKDLDNDGYDDLIIEGSFATTYWLKNNLPNVNSIRGSLFWDRNKNLVFDSIDISIPKAKIKMFPTPGFSYTSSSGVYSRLVKSGTYNVKPELAPFWKLISDSADYTVTVDNNKKYADSLDFAFAPDSAITDFNVTIIHEPYRCNEIVNHWIDVSNVGSREASAELFVILPSSHRFLNSSPHASSISNDTIVWSLDTVSFFQTKRINILAKMPDFKSMGDTMTIRALLRTTDSDGNTDLFSFKDSMVFRCAYDPNDKVVSPIGLNKPGYIENQKMTYQIRFQNTGNDTAKTVVIRDVIDPNLKLSSLSVVASSHPMNLSFRGREAVFTFADINLPDTSKGNNLSQGVVRYTIDPKASLSHLTNFDNQARIYFDNNPAIVTNTVRNTIVDCGQVSFDTRLRRQDSSLISYADTKSEKSWMDCDNKMIYQHSIDTLFTPKSAGKYKVVLRELYCTDTSLCYTIDLKSNNISVAYQSNNWSVRAYPNPVSQELTLTYDLADKTELKVFTQGGLQVNLPYSVTSEGASLETANLEPGLYIVHLIRNNSKAVVRFVKY